MRLHGKPTTARQRLVESSGTPFAPGPVVRPVVSVMDGRKRNDEIDPTAWRRALEAGDGSVAIYFTTSTDHEWWLAFDPDGEYPDDLDGPYLLWSSYPGGTWDHTPLSQGLLDTHLEELYGEHDRDRECEIYRSKVVCLEDAPDFIQQTVGDDRHD